MLEIRRIRHPGEGDHVPLLQAYLTAIGEPLLDEAGIERVAVAIDAGRIHFFAAYVDGRAVGICSLTFAWSTYGGGAPVGTFEDFYVSPEHRRRGVARALVERVFTEAEAEGCRSVVVGCSESDAPMYRALGFTARLGTLLAGILPIRAM